MANKYGCFWMRSTRATTWAWSVMSCVITPCSVDNCLKISFSLLPATHTSTVLKSKSRPLAYKARISPTNIRDWSTESIHYQSQWSITCGIMVLWRQTTKRPTFTEWSVYCQRNMRTCWLTYSQSLKILSEKLRITISALVYGMFTDASSWSNGLGKWFANGKK